MKKPVLTLVLAASALALVSCNQQPDNSAQAKSLEDRIRQLEDQEKQLQLQTQEDKLAADRAALEAEKQKLREQQIAIEQATPTNKPDTASSSSFSGAATSSADYQDDSGPKVTQRSDTGSSYNLFYDRLQPEGRWFEEDTYGYVWQPGIAERDDNWRPYTDGHWAYTDRGWTWISNEDFGWATYHYGRWTRVQGVGWIWVPGNTWAPAWVSWRQTDHDDYVGWAPLPPECNPTPSVKVEAWVDNYYDIGPAAYVFLKVADLVRPSYREAILPPQQNVTIITQTRNVTNITYNNNVVKSFGPQYQQLAQATNNRLEHYQINYQQQTQPNANFKTVVAGNQLQVIAPPPQLQPRATIQPQAVRQIQHAQVERGWQNIDPAKTQQIKQAFQQTAPSIPKALPPQPAPPPKPIIAAAPSRKPGQPPAAVQQFPKHGTPLNNNQIAAERAKIEAEKAQLEQQRQALLTGQKPANPAAPQNQKPNQPSQPNQPQQAEQQQKEQALKQQQQAEAEKAKQFEAQKAQQAAQSRLQQETQQKLQAEQQQKEPALKQQQQAEAEQARQLEAQKAQQAAQARLQQETQQKLQAEQQQKELALKQQQQAEAEQARQLEAQKSQQAAQARLQQEAQQKLQTEQQQKEQALKQQQQHAVAEKSKQPEKKAPEEKKKKEEKTPPPGQPQQ